MTNDEKTTGMNAASRRAIRRRKFLAGAGAAISVAVVRPEAVVGAQANSRIKIGVIGCGGRGNWIAGLVKAHDGYEIVAGADYFQDRLDGFGQKFEVPKNRLYSGLSGYKRLIAEADVDAVFIESPPYFHPEQAAAAVAAGKHVYVAKPIAVDVPGCKTIEQTGKEGRKKGLCVLIDFQTRADDFYTEALKRVHEGAIGKFSFGESTYHAGDPFGRMRKAMEENPNDPENRLRSWGVDRVLSGDIITEQNIHTLDVASWIMDAAPISAYGSYSQKIRLFGTCADHFSAVINYADGVDVSFSSRQFNGHGTQPEGIRNRMFGTEGTLETQYGGQVMIRGNGEKFYRGGKSPGIFKDGAVRNIADFHKAILAKDCSNKTVEPSVRSNMLTVLARTAAYKHSVVTWADLLRDNKRCEYDLSGLRD